eukprot:scaffold167_cov347-Prasinococcus_capsulatus_cf.AAC.18
MVLGHRRARWSESFFSSRRSESCDVGPRDSHVWVLMRASSWVLITTGGRRPSAVIGDCPTVHSMAPAYGNRCGAVEVDDETSTGR